MPPFDVTVTWVADTFVVIFFWRSCLNLIYHNCYALPKLIIYFISVGEGCIFIKTALLLCASRHFNCILARYLLIPNRCTVFANLFSYYQLCFSSDFASYPNCFLGYSNSTHYPFPLLFELLLFSILVHVHCWRLFYCCHSIVIQ